MTPVPFWGQAWRLARRDLLIEGRAGEVTSLTLPFGAVALMVVPLTTEGSPGLLAEVGPAVYWLVALVFGMQVALRQTSTETAPQRELLALLGVDPAARFTGRSLAGGLLLVGFLLALAPLVWLFYLPDPLPGAAWMLPVLLLFAAGVAMLGVLAGDVTVGLRTRTALAPLLVAPLAVPLLIGASQAAESLSRGESILTWTLLLVAADLGLAITGVLTARPLEEAAT